MEGVYNGHSAKRSHSYHNSEGIDRSGRQKRRTVSDIDESAYDTEYRILCPASKIGSIIGKGGNIIKSLRDETRSKIKIEDHIPGSDERVIYICSSGNDKSRNKEMLCAAQEALFKVHERIIDGQSGFSNNDDDDESSNSVVARLLVPNKQVGCLIGKGGQIIEQMRRDIGGQIRVLPKEQRPLCAMPDDEIVQLSGDPEVVGKALYAISSRLHENPLSQRNQRDGPSNQLLPTDNPLFPPVGHGGSSLTFPPTGAPPMSLGHSFPFEAGLSGIGNVWSLGFNLPSLSAYGGSQIPTEGLTEQFVIRILCPDEVIGSIIGKGGLAIRKLRDETGAKIQVNDPDSDERIIEITTNEYLESPISQGINSALHVQRRIADLLADKDRDMKTVTARLLVPSFQIGALIGKGGSVINEIRKVTRANIKISSKDQRPPSAGEDNELVQIVGDFEVVEYAIIQVLTMLRNNLFKGQDGGGIPPSLAGVGPTLPGYGNTSPGRLYSLNGLGFQSSTYSSYSPSLDRSSRRSTKERRKE